MVSVAREGISVWAPAPPPASTRGQHSPLSSICSWPDFVEATTLAAISLTVREHSCRRLRLGLCLSAFTWGRVGEGQGGPPGIAPVPWPPGHTQRVPCPPTPGAEPRPEPHLGGRHQLGRAGCDLVGADDELLVLARVQHHLVSRLPGDGSGRAWVSDPMESWAPPHAPCCPPPGATYTSCVAPQPTALEAEMRPSVQREFLA